MLGSSSGMANEKSRRMTTAKKSGVISRSGDEMSTRRLCRKRVQTVPNQGGSFDTVC